MDIFGDIFGGITQKLIELVARIINLLPDSPFHTVNNADVNSFLGGLNWVLPIAQMISILEAWLIVVAVYYTYQLILRWARMIK
ncbi:hypothetical protein [Pseudobacteroides cellulosolvens]|nr:hypothetical protein [Pseudobacteroides cellulosolvens]